MSENDTSVIPTSHIRTNVQDIFVINKFYFCGDLGMGTCRVKKSKFGFDQLYFCLGIRPKKLTKQCSRKNKKKSDQNEKI